MQIFIDMAELVQDFWGAAFFNLPYPRIFDVKKAQAE